MIQSLRFPLLAKVLGWLILHLVILGLSFVLFVRWQLDLGLDSLVSGSAGERLGDFGDTVVSRLVDEHPKDWDDLVHELAKEKKLEAALLRAAGDVDFPGHVPPEVLDRARASLPPTRAEAGPPGGPGRPMRPRYEAKGGRRPPRGFDADEEDVLPFEGGAPPFEGDLEESESEIELSSLFSLKSKPTFLMRAADGDGYWAGVLLHMPPVRGLPRKPLLLLLRADRLDGSGMFFEFKPWLWGGIAVLMLSLAFWTPFVWSITRYVRRLTAAADRIAAGDFQVSIPSRGNDELGNLGTSIETMASRLDHLVSGQKRFLGDAAHELCAPLARIRTGLGILEMSVPEKDSASLSSIEADTAELASLVNEILAFSRAGVRAPSMRSVEIEPLVQEALVRESADVDAKLVIPPGLTLTADPALLGRAIGNLIRNASIHAGPRPKVTIEAAESNDAVTISVTDNGPGVPAEEVSRLFEPFYRLDRSRSRDTGGSGLGLAIVRNAVEACGGKTSASLPDAGGFRVTMRFPKELA